MGAVPGIPAAMPDADDIDQQQDLLATHRRTLAIYLQRHAIFGFAYAPPQLIHGISEARTAIQRIKTTLRSWGVTVEDHPDDATPVATLGVLPPYRAAVLRMIEDYAAVFGGRDAELTVLDAFLEQTEQSCALLLEPTGRGKTALLTHWLLQVQARSEWVVAYARWKLLPIAPRKRA